MPNFAAYGSPSCPTCHGLAELEITTGRHGSRWYKITCPACGISGALRASQQAAHEAWVTLVTFTALESPVDDSKDDR